MDLGMIVLRLLHVGGGILWAGGAVLITRFLTPAALALGPAGAPFMGRLTARKLTEFMTTVAAITVLAGSVVYWVDANGDIVRFFTGGSALGLMGTGLGIGGIAAWLAFLEGVLVTGPTVKRMGGLGAQLAAAAAGGPPPADLVAGMQATQAKLRQSATLTFALVAIAVVCMSTARYW